MRRSTVAHVMMVLQTSQFFAPNYLFRYFLFFVPFFFSSVRNSFHFFLSLRADDVMDNAVRNFSAAPFLKPLSRSWFREKWN